jgi:hypothetical protein
MGGRIGYADNPGGGSVFWLELPARRVAVGRDTGRRAVALDRRNAPVCGCLSSTTKR